MKSMIIGSRFLIMTVVLGWGIQLLPAQPVPVRHTEGLVHGFLVLRALDGNILASGDLAQVAKGDTVTAQLVFRFKDGSLHDETSVFSQRGTFRLLTYHLIQKGPAFKRQTDLTLNASTGQVTVHYADDGKEKTVTDQLKVPEEVANGLVSTLLSEIDPKTPKTMLSMVASTPKPRLVKLAISPEGDESFWAGGQALKAIRYLVKVEIGGVDGVVAPIIGKQPPDTHVWVLAGKAPVFLKSEGPLYDDGPIWRIELASPVWPKSSREERP
jgi:hypothetical protein